MIRRGRARSLTRTLRADIPPTEVDETFVARLAELASHSVPPAPLPLRTRPPSRALRVFAVAASVATICLGVAFGTAWLGQVDVAPASGPGQMDPVAPAPAQRTAEPEDGDQDGATHDDDRMDVEKRTDADGDAGPATTGLAPDRGTGEPDARPRDATDQPGRGPAPRVGGRDEGHDDVSGGADDRGPGGERSSGSTDDAGGEDRDQRVQEPTDRSGPEPEEDETRSGEGAGDGPDEPGDTESGQKEAS